ncbi:MAG: VCBS repeat-containing protein [Planctomycetes bacterium]|nr:VCBS repeat-containing protein [Planctomycetota bacterium]
MNRNDNDRRNPPFQHRLRHTQRTATAALMLLAACGGGGGGTDAAARRDLETALNTLGVDTTRTARETAPGLRIEASTSPLGNKPVLARTNELALINVGLRNPTNPAPLLLLDLTDSNGNATQDLMFGQDANQVAFLPQTGSQSGVPGASSCACAADLDGSGLQEIVFVYQSGVETRLRRYDDQTAGLASLDAQFATHTQVTHVHAIAADLDNDGDDEIVLGLTAAGVGRVSVWRWEANTLVQVGADFVVPPDIATGQMVLQLAAGNLDHDAGLELALMVEETFGNSGSARYVLLDDVGSDLGVLRTEPFLFRDQNQTMRVAMSGSIALGDFDGDGLDEIALAGLTAFATGCQSSQQLVVALDDRIGGFATLAAVHETVLFPNCNSPSNRRIRTIHLHALDVDGDGRSELAANHQLYDDFVDSAPLVVSPSLTLPQATVWNSGSFGWFARNSSSFAVGDFTGDDRDDLAVYRQDRGVAEIYGLPATGNAIQLLRSVPVPGHNSQSPMFPALLPVDVDTDSAVLRHSAADYKLVFSEPIVLAALAAPPTQGGIGQNVAGSYTAFGNTSTTTSERERSVTFSASVSVGVNLDGGFLTQSEFSLSDTLKAAATRTQGTAYELSKTILFTGAPTEDLVVFTSVPVDQYTFTILSHPDPTLIGERVVVQYPREPVTLQAERGFFNQAVPGNAVRIDESVFRHRIGDLASYPTASQKNALLGLNNGLQVGPVGVGQGGGSTEVTLQVGAAISSGGALAIGYERSVEATAGGVLVGVSIGVDAERTWRITSGQSTTYTGVVGAIEAASFAANRYSFGLFTYVHRDPRTQQQFQVLNYWVVR